MAFEPNIGGLLSMSLIDVILVRDRPADLGQVRRILYPAVALCFLYALFLLFLYANQQGVKNLSDFWPLLQTAAKSLLAELRGGWVLLLFLAQASMIGYMVLVRPRVYATTAHSTATAAVVQFYFWWKFLWVSWLMLYLGMAALAVAGHWQGEKALSYGSLAITLLLNLNTFAMGALYLLMTNSTIPADASAGLTRSRPGTVRARSFLTSLFTLPQGQADTSVRVVCTGLTGFLLWGSLALVLFTVLEAACAKFSGGYLIVFKWVSGIVAGLVFALFVGRLDSKPLDTPSWMLALLYLYAVIQPGYAAFDSLFGWLVLTNLALYLKCLLFLHVSRRLESGAMLYYMYTIREFIEQGDFMRQQFLAAADAKEAVQADAPWQRAIVESIGKEEARCRVTIHEMDFPINLPATVLRHYHLEPNMDFELRLSRDGHVSVDDVRILSAPKGAADANSLLLQKLNIVLASDFWDNPPQSRLPWRETRS